MSQQPVDVLALIDARLIQSRDARARWDATRAEREATLDVLEPLATGAATRNAS